MSEANEIKRACLSCGMRSETEVPDRFGNWVATEAFYGERWEHLTEEQKRLWVVEGAIGRSLFVFEILAELGELAKLPEARRLLRIAVGNSFSGYKLLCKQHAALLKEIGGE